jgi:dipeptidyl aminopeptidase/acylaminoacyl peptidase
MTIRVQIAAAAVALLCAAATTLAETQPIESFARRPQMYGVTISSDGRFIAFLSGVKDDTVLMTFDRAQTGGSFRRVTESEPGKFDLGWCRWANAKRLLCGLYGNYVGKTHVEMPFKRLFAIDADGAAFRSLDQNRDVANTFVSKTSMRNFNMGEGGGAGSGGRGNPAHYADWHMKENAGFGMGGASAIPQAPERQDEFIDLNPDDDDTVLILIDDDGDSFPTIFQLNIYSGNAGVKLAENPPMRRFVTDGEGNPRIGWGTQDLKTFYFARLDGDREWRKLGTTDAFDTSNRLRPIAMAPGADTAYALGSFEGRDALWSIDLADQRPPRLLFKHPLVDVGEPILKTDRRLLGVRYDVERPYVWYAEEYQRQLVERMERQFAGSVIEIVDTSQDKSIFVIQVSSDVDLGTYYLFDSVNVKLSKLGTSYPELDPKSLGTMTNISYKASDGTEVPGYLTIPSGAEKKDLPLIVMPHDGPGLRDSWKFSYLRTFLANRGYAVLQTNFRGSAGFGHTWRMAAHQDWGGLTYTDILDAARWAVNEGIADPKRVCILGSGFGGYQALLGAARNGDTFRCAVSIAGIADLAKYQEQGALSGEEEFRRAQIGTDKEKVKRNSPVEIAAQIRVPVLLIHGTRDWQVQPDQTSAMARALRKQNKKYSEVIIKGAGHEFERQSERVTLLREVEGFLAANIGAGAAN